MKNKSFKIIFLNLLVSSACILTSVIIFFFQNYKGYELLFTQPILYLIIYVTVFSKIIFKDSSRLFFSVLASISGIRYVLLPLLTVLSAHYGGRSIVEPDSNSFFKAILLMNYELISIAIFLKIMESKKNNKGIKKNKINFDFRNQHIGYFIFLLITLSGIFMFPSVLQAVNLIKPSSLDYILNFNTTQNIILYCILISKQLVFIILIKKFYRLYFLNKNRIFILLCFIISLINIFIYIGTNRSDIIISAIVSFVMLYKLFGRLIRKYFFVGIPLLLFIVFIVSVGRNHASFSRSFFGEENVLVDTTDTFQAYTGGAYNVAIALETKEYYPNSNELSVLFFDIFRPMIGINIFIKNLPFNYSNVFFNQRMWLNVDRRSQIIPMIGQGNLFFGYILSPLFSLIIIRFYYYLEKIWNKTTSLEVYYFLSLVLVRFGFFMGQNTMNMINDLSMNLVLFLIVFVFNKLIKSSSIYHRYKIKEVAGH